MPIFPLEILHRISYFCDPPTNAITAVVCKGWSDESLNRLWYQVDDLEQLLSLFGELRAYSRPYQEGHYYLYRDGRPTHKGWLRFQTIYQHRIRILGPITDQDSYLEPLAALAMLRSSGPLLPRLHTLIWENCAFEETRNDERCLMFMNESVRTFKIAGDPADDTIIDSLETLFSCTSARMPKLTSLEVDFPPLDEYQLPLLDLVRNLPDLTELIIPPFPGLTVILQSLSNLGRSSRLSHLGIASSKAADSDEPGEVTVIDLSGVESHGFSQLRMLHIHATYDAASQIFLQTWPLTEVSIHCHTPASIIATAELVSRIASSCPNLEELTLSFFDMSIETLITLEDAPPQLVTISDLEPLLRCAKISLFHLDTIWPLSLSDTDIQRLARSWPSLRYLSLTPVPGFLVPERVDKVSLRSLLHLAKSCPKLCDLHLLFDNQDVQLDDLLQELRIKGILQFKRLLNFGVGFSPIHDWLGVATFLSKILPPSVPLLWGCGPDEWIDTDHISPDIKSSWDHRWKRVGSFLAGEHAIAIVSDDSSEE
ncbi:hypothetical protein F5879DRAFT_613906 [Lentinula edodes]|nr:hypothetical protein F5879DRAFT_613906 [Lentinula edodes]